MKITNVILLMSLLLCAVYAPRASGEDFVQDAHQRCNPTKPIEAAQLPYCEIDAASGNADAEAVMCALYHSGTFLQQDFSSAAVWCLKAAKQGRSVAQIALGRIYGKGEGVPRDNTEAYAWLSVAAAGDPRDKFTRLARDGKDVLAVIMTKDEKRQADKKASAYITKYQNNYGQQQNG
jgi:TPR repeat protein